ncbi:unknown [Lachnospiraceae bacterium CAG:215]|nr:unknown [Lachnospiraceae bacterium CAG:215]
MISPSFTIALIPFSFPSLYASCPLPGDGSGAPLIPANRISKPSFSASSQLENSFRTFISPVTTAGSVRYVLMKYAPAFCPVSGTRPATLCVTSSTVPPPTAVASLNSKYSGHPGASVSSFTKYPVPGFKPKICRFSPCFKDCVIVPFTTLPTSSSSTTVPSEAFTILIL